MSSVMIDGDYSQASSRNAAPHSDWGLVPSKAMANTPWPFSCSPWPFLRKAARGICPHQCRHAWKAPTHLDWKASASSSCPMPPFSLLPVAKRYNAAV
jgi:hypothetical protein